MRLLIFVIIILIAYAITSFILNIYQKYKGLEMVVLQKEMEILRLNNIIKRNLLISSFKSPQSSYQNPDIIDAVKLAMKVSHPDNGGASNDFIKYKNLYNKLKGGIDER